MCARGVGLRREEPSSASPGEAWSSALCRQQHEGSTRALWFNTERANIEAVGVKTVMCCVVCGEA